MHMADALLAPAVAGTMYVLSGTAAGLSVRELRKENAPEKLPVMAVYLVICLDEGGKFPFILRHYLKDKWARNVTRDWD
jgi:hypothetical protein